MFTVTPATPTTADTITATDTTDSTITGSVTLPAQSTQVATHFQVQILPPQGQQGGQNGGQQGGQNGGQQGGQNGGQQGGQNGGQQGGQNGGQQGGPGGVQILVVALDASNNPVVNYTGTVQITSTGTGDTLPAAYTFTAGDAGAHVFTVTPASPTTADTFTVTDTTDSSLTGSAVLPALT
ncbi:hypothetical protein [Fimbriiglobus ruber]|uniref:Ribose ABC transport system, periplasmic ribose-binding protein RbsB n=1 Tax=Fimbriiglobus ruber TaxID=1908690 RepID=A0A225DJL7_9BACT|nr:hypothetical protein [Fimbriiglobus ruber]OWK41651.1 Ribose ABC transport system, periplasmic ribose-binding protein RbsB [Fimbriiglobus ruber]